MARLFNDPGSFAEEMLEGFAAAQAHRVRRVPGGVVRRNRSRSGEVAVVIGGGSVGVEIAGELGDLHGKASSAPKDITILSGTSRLLSALRPAIGKRAEEMLVAQGVSVVHGVRLDKQTKLPDGGASVNTQFHDPAMTNATPPIPVKDPTAMSRFTGITSSPCAGPRALFLNLSWTSPNFGLFFSISRSSSSDSLTTP